MTRLKLSHLCQDENISRGLENLAGTPTHTTKFDTTKVQPTALAPRLSLDNQHLSQFPIPVVSTLPTTVNMSTSELAASYAALILADDGIEITVRKSRTSL